MSELRPIDGIVVFGGYLGSWILVVSGLGAVLPLKTLVLASTVIPAAVAYLMLRSATDRPLCRVGLVPAKPKVLVCAVIASLAAIVPVLSLESAFLSGFGVPKELLEEFSDMIRADSPLELAYVLAVAAAGAAAGEELVFRGILQTSLASWFGRRGAGWPAVLVASVVFGLLHDAWRFPAAFALGVFLGILYWRTASLLVPVVAHFTINCTAIVVPYLAGTGRVRMLPDWVRDDKPAPAWLVGLSLAVLAALLRGIWASGARTSELREGRCS